MSTYVLYFIRGERVLGFINVNYKDRIGKDSSIGVLRLINVLNTGPIP